MRSIDWPVLVVLGFFCALDGQSDVPLRTAIEANQRPAEIWSRRIVRAIRLLRSPSWRVRERATQVLIAAGTRATPSLVLVAGSTDLEVALRVRRILSLRRARRTRESGRKPAVKKAERWRRCHRSGGTQWLESDIPFASLLRFPGVPEKWPSRMIDYRKRAAHALSKHRVTLSWKLTPVVDVLRFVTKGSDVTVSLSPAAKAVVAESKDGGLISITLANVTLRTALKSVATRYGLIVRQYHGALVITTPSEPDAKQLRMQLSALIAQLDDKVWRLREGATIELVKLATPYALLVKQTLREALIVCRPAELEKRTRLRALLRGL